MKTLQFGLFRLSVVVLSIITNRAAGDSFGSGPNAFDIQFVTVGAAGNVADTTAIPNPVGSVSYLYRIGVFEISESMIAKANAAGFLNITASNRGANKPATNITWLEAATFVNWLNTNTGHTPAYKFNAGSFELWQAGDIGFNAANRYRNSLATYFLPSVDEWYKAGFYDPIGGNYFDYATGGNTAPTPVPSGTAPGTTVSSQTLAAGPADITLAGGLSPYGTMAQSGNATEWEETDVDLINDSTSSERIIRGGSWVDSPQSNLSWAGRFPNLEVFDVGFRVASIASVVPEPSTLSLAALALIPLALRSRTTNSIRQNKPWREE